MPSIGTESLRTNHEWRPPSWTAVSQSASRVRRGPLVNQGTIHRPMRPWEPAPQTLPDGLTRNT